jgi:hypothetical protein
MIINFINKYILFVIQILLSEYDEIKLVILNYVISSSSSFYLIFF